MTKPKRQKFLADLLRYWTDEEEKAVRAGDAARREICAKWRAVTKRALDRAR